MKTKEEKAEKYASETWSDTPMSGKPRNEYLYRLSSKELAKSAYLAGYDEAQVRADEEILDLKSSRDAWKHLHEQALSMVTATDNRLRDADAVITEMERALRNFIEHGRDDFTEDNAHRALRTLAKYRDAK